MTRLPHPSRGASGAAGVAVRVVPNLTSGGLTARKLGVMEWVLVASSAYLEKRPPPRSPAELTSHVCLELAHAKDRGV